MRSVVALCGSLFALTALLAVAPAALAGGGCHPSGGSEPVAASGTDTVVRIDGCTFLPAIDRVPVGAEVTFLNTAVSAHDVTGRMWSWQSPMLDPGDSYSRRFTEPGIFPYSCSLHPGMAGVIEVADIDATLTSATTAESSDPVEGAVDLAPLAAGGFGLALGALASSILLRRRSVRAD